MNADGYVSTGQGILGNNMFAYCGNNPVMRVDHNGNFWLLALAITAVVTTVALTSCSYEDLPFEEAPENTWMGYTPYKTKNEAVDAAQKSIEQAALQSASSGACCEYTCKVYRYEVDGLYYITKPKTDSMWGLVTSHTPLPQSKLVADFHTHPPVNSGTPFSADDMNFFKYNGGDFDMYLSVLSNDYSRIDMRALLPSGSTSLKQTKIIYDYYASAGMCGTIGHRIIVEV